MGVNRLQWDSKAGQWVSQTPSGKDAKKETEDKALKVAETTDKNIARIADALCG